MVVAVGGGGQFYTRNKNPLNWNYAYFSQPPSSTTKDSSLIRVQMGFKPLISFLIKQNPVVANKVFL